ncbi:hypothetical protein [Pseudotamlana carrageenivorans]|uniref:STAS/SEC14 domain-containing protein n=1 Tax=Pseudotamlana carrageenivorans TaxID=2069432 RepID=A0A2I7SJQ8_9FLAO|nr:hypothetical protein [Tamlana carrageenivorans]AUS06139.1 hypothetical protein C1A40_12065 [Tamlana carrageenivorans]
MKENIPDSTYAPPTWKHHNNVEYINMDFSKLSSDEMVINFFADTLDLVLQRPDKSVRVFADVKSIKIKPSTMRVLKEYGKKGQPKVKKSVMVGTVGLVSLLMKVYVNYTGSKMKFFTDYDIAMEYLTSD